MVLLCQDAFNIRSNANRLTGDQIRILREQKKAREEQRERMQQQQQVANDKHQAAKDIRPEHHRLPSHPVANMPPLIPVKQLQQPSPPPIIELRNDFKFPMMSKRDSSNGRLVQTLLNGQFLAAFEIGGEHRVCLKQVIHQIPKQFSDSLINRGIASNQLIYKSRWSKHF